MIDENTSSPVSPDITEESKNTVSTVSNKRKAKSLWDSQYRVINNPGRGNCAYYAFAIGLMPYLKSALESSTEKNYLLANLLNKLETWYLKKNADKRNKKYLWEKFKSRIQEYDYHKNYRIDHFFLEEFHHLLRYILVESYKKKLNEIILNCDEETKKQDLLAITLVNEGIVALQVELDTDIARHVSHIKSSSLFNSFLEYYPEYNSSQVQQSIREKRDKLRLAYFLSLLFSDSIKVINANDSEEKITADLIENIQLPRESPLARCLAQKGQNGHEGEDSDLIFLAEQLEINLVISNVDLLSSEAENTEEISVHVLHSVIAKNEGHWETLMPKSALIPSIQKYCEERPQRAYNNTSYSSGFGYFFGYTQEDKINTAKALEEIIQGNKNTLSYRERDILNQGFLKKTLKSTLKKQGLKNPHEPTVDALIRNYKITIA